MSPKDNVAYMREWAADIRKHSGKSVDADRCDAVADEIDHLRALNAEMRDKLKECADDLESRIEHAFNQIGRHKAMERDYEADISLVKEARAIDATNTRGIREAPAVTALRRQPDLSDLIDKADDLRKRDKGE